MEAPGLVGAFRATLARGGWGALYKAWHAGLWVSMQGVTLGAHPEPALAQPCFSRTLDGQSCCNEDCCFWAAACWPQVPCRLMLTLHVSG